MAKQTFRSPKDLLTHYSNGFVGAYCDPIELEELVSTLEEPKYALAGIRGSGSGKLSRPYLSVVALSKERPYLERQTTGDCVSHGTRNAVDISRAVQIHVGRSLESFVALGATEGIYGSRGHGGQGMSCAGAARWVNQKGGLLVRKNYGVIDFTTYDANKGAKWGSRGVPSEIEEIARKNPVKSLIQIKSIDDARDALANGYGVCVCSNQGFASQRDNKGFAKPQGNWSHAMAWIACDDTGSEPAFLVQNSWGKWNDGGHPEWGPIPDGSFLITASVAASMIRSDSSFAFSSVVGFPPTKLPNYGFNYI